MIPIIDTHQHLWDLKSLSLNWVKGDKVMDHSYLMSDYLEASKGTGIEQTVYMEVNVNPECVEDEIQQMSDHCASSQTPMRKMVIAGNPSSPEFESFLNKHTQNQFVRGLRWVLHIPETKPGHCLQAGFIQGIQEMGRRGLLFDICIRPSELSDATKLVAACPETTFVIDHCGNADPHIVNGEKDLGDAHDGSPFWHTAKGWKEDIAALGALPNTFCKISGIVARAQEGWNAETLAPTINHCLDSFGEARVLFGGDWPVCLFGAPLHQWVAAYREVLSKRSEIFQKKAMYSNAIQLYRLHGS